MKIILVNGPPGSGKDTAAQAVKGCIRCKFAKFVKEGTHVSFGLDLSTYPMDAFETVKDQPNPLFYGKTPREAYMAHSQIFMKPFTGDLSIFGRLMARWIKQRMVLGDCLNRPFVITDSGFKEEAEVLVDIFRPESIKLIRVHREGCTFKGDSRGYINLDNRGVCSTDIFNTEIEKYYSEINATVQKFMQIN